MAITVNSFNWTRRKKTLIERSHGTSPEVTAPEGPGLLRALYFETRCRPISCEAGWKRASACMHLPLPAACLTYLPSLSPSLPHPSLPVVEPVPRGACHLPTRALPEPTDGRTSTHCGGFISPCVGQPICSNSNHCRHWGRPVEKSKSSAIIRLTSATTTVHKSLFTTQLQDIRLTTV